MSSDDEDEVDAAGLRGLLEDKWVKIQENTFRNWVNQQLRETDHEIGDIGSKTILVVSELYTKCLA